MDLELLPNNSMTFCENQHGNDILEKVKAQRDSSRFADVLLVVEGKQFLAHRCILAACSPFFDSIFKANVNVKEQLKISADNPDVFQTLLLYIYTGTIIINKDNVSPLLKLADKLLLTKLKDYCTEYLQRYLEKSNCLTVLEMTYRFGLDSLQKVVTNLISQNLFEIIEGDEILNVPLSRLENFINCPNWSIPGEKILSLLLSWVYQYEELRQGNFRSLLTWVSWKDIKPDDVQGLLRAHPLFASSIKYELMLRKTIKEQSQEFYEILPPCRDLKLDEPVVSLDSDKFINMAIGAAINTMDGSILGDTLIDRYLLDADKDQYLQGHQVNNQNLPANGEETFPEGQLLQTTHSDVLSYPQFQDHHELRYDEVSYTQNHHQPQESLPDEVTYQNHHLSQERIRDEISYQQNHFSSQKEIPDGISYQQSRIKRELLPEERLSYSQTHQDIFTEAKQSYFQNQLSQNENLDYSNDTARDAEIDYIKVEESHRIINNSKYIRDSYSYVPQNDPDLNQDYRYPYVHSPSKAQSYDVNEIPSRTEASKHLLDDTNTQITCSNRWQPYKKENNNYDTQQPISPFCSTSLNSKLVFSSMTNIVANDNHPKLHNNHIPSPIIQTNLDGNSLNNEQLSKELNSETPMDKHSDDKLIISSITNYNENVDAGDSQQLSKDDNYCQKPPIGNTIDDVVIYPKSKINKMKSLVRKKYLDNKKSCEETIQLHADTETTTITSPNYSTEMQQSRPDDEVILPEESQREVTKVLSPTKMNANNKVDSPGSSKKCEICDRKFSKNKFYIKHMVSHFPGPPHHCDTCGSSFKRIYYLLDHRKVHSEDKNFKCPHCPFSSRRQFNLKTHMSLHNADERTFKCEECGMQFKRKDHLAVHTTKHSSRRPFFCDICDWSGKTKNSLLLHSKMHSGDLYSCQYGDCAYRTAKKSHLDAHMQYHTQSRPFECQLCGGRFISKFHLTRHRKQKHQILKDYSCPHCHFGTSRLDALRNHVKKKHSAPACPVRQRKPQLKKRDAPRAAAPLKPPSDSIHAHQDLSPAEDVINNQAPLLSGLSSTSDPELVDKNDRHQTQQSFPCPSVETLALDDSHNAYLDSSDGQALPFPAILDVPYNSNRFNWSATEEDILRWSVVGDM